MNMNKASYTLVDSPLGRILLVGDQSGLIRITFQAGSAATHPAPTWKRRDDAFDDARRQLAAYFAGERRDFDLSLAPRGTPFQRAVWQAVRRIPYGRTATYGEIARRIRKQTAFRAVGAANGANPLPIVIPCHRVIGSNGRLTGYSGGLHLKEALLALERTHAPRASQRS
jgi:methylated-DNA-[protein]-cysteine S-methyltransferase